jgi:hypothetical protein
MGAIVLLLELACLRMLLGKKVMSQKKKLLAKWEGEKQTYKFLPYPYLNSQNLVAGNH